MTKVVFNDLKLSNSRLPSHCSWGLWLARIKITIVINLPLIFYFYFFIFLLRIYCIHGYKILTKRFTFNQQSLKKPGWNIFCDFWPHAVILISRHFFKFRSPRGTVRSCCRAHHTTPPNSPTNSHRVFPSLSLVLQQGVRFDPDLPQTIRLEFAKSNTKVSKPKQILAPQAVTQPPLVHPLTGRK